MRKHHLAILGLDERATEREIKKRYRLLVKKYHPDVNSDPDAAEKFLAVDNAYEYLTRNSDFVQEVIDYNNHLKEEIKARQERIKKARERAWKKKQEERRQQAALLKTLGLGVTFLGILNIIFLIDMCLPKKEITEELLIVQHVTPDLFKKHKPNYKTSTDASHERYFKFIMKNHKIIISDKSVLPTTPNVRLKISSLLRFSTAVSYDGRTIPVFYSLYRIFDFVIYAMIVAAGMFFYFEQKFEFRFGLTALIFVLALTQLVVFMT